MRVLLVLPGLMESGATRVDLDLAEQWAALGHPTEVFVPQRFAKGRLADPGAVTVTYGTSHRGRFRNAVPEVLARLVAAARRADLVVSGSEIGNGLLLGRLAARIARRPFVTIVHASPAYMNAVWTPRRLQPLVARALGSSDAVVCVAPDLVDEVVDLGVSRARVVHVPNGRDVAALRRRARELRGASAGAGAPVVVGVGRLVEQKGFDLLVRAHAVARRRGADHRLRLVGDGPDRDDLQRLATELGCAGTVELAGFSDDVARATADAAVFCLSSRHEGTPLVLLEAMALGLPVIATDCSTGVRQLLGDGRYGELVATSSVEALADALTRHLPEPVELQERVESAREHVEAFSTEASARRYVAFLDSVLSAA